MAAASHRFDVDTHGDTHVIDITKHVARCVDAGGIACGTATAFVIGSTAGITTTEFEPGLVNHDLKAAFEALAPVDGDYLHEATWHDDNGHAHVRASLLGPSVTVPIVDGQLQLGTWQQIILIDFDTRPRSRTIIVQVIGA
ncbi:MAG: secondary thiamine-phosphate synthase enzyme YjbQ [Phycisphaerae bacterium]